MTASPMEYWNLYLDHDYQAVPWPWPETPWEMLTAAQAAALPRAIADFTRYSPSDGTVDMAQVPAAIPRELPVAVTRLAIYHDPEFLYLFIDAARPAQPIPALSDETREDFSCVIALDGVARGIYCGLNDQNEAIACVQIWDGDLQPEGADDDWPFSLMHTDRGAGPSASVGGIIREGFDTRVFSTAAGLIGAFRLARRWLVGGIRDKTLRLSVGRVCYATAEWLSWGSPIIWSPRPDKHGAVRLVDAAAPSHLPRLSRLDLHYHPEEERGTLVATWHTAAPEMLARLARGGYADYMSKATFALNGCETILPLGETTHADVAIADGWNRLEVLTATGEPVVVNFQKCSGHRLQAPKASAELPGLDELNHGFRAWHAANERRYLGAGTWGDPNARGHCLCHDGIFQMLPYLFACRYLDAEPIYEQRIRETCARMLAHQQPGGWFPCGCSSADALDQVAALGDGGAFTNGSVGEGLALAGAQFHEPTWVEASIRAADYRWYRWECNQNYAAFALWHLAALQTLAPRDEWTDKACYLAQFATRDLGPGGAQDGHNYYTGYGDITLKGMARLLAVLPPAHPEYARLRDKTLRFTNQILSRQQPNGLFAGRNRKYLGYHHPVAGLFDVADALPEYADDLAPALGAMTRTLLDACYGGEHRDYENGVGIVMGLMARLIMRKASCR